MKATTQISKFDGEYRIRLFIDGEYQAGADYFTDDQQDARDTAAAMRKNALQSDKSDVIAVAEQEDHDEEHGHEVEEKKTLETYLDLQAFEHYRVKGEKVSLCGERVRRVSVTALLKSKNIPCACMKCVDLADQMAARGEVN